MNLKSLIKLGWRHFNNTLAEEVFLKTGFDYTRPTTVHALLTKQCNSRCRYCEYWRQEKDESAEEMTVEEWQQVLGGLKRFLGLYFIEFSGGEPLVKKGFLQICRFCSDQNIRFGITTNGLTLSEHAGNIVEANPSNINISIDAPSAPVHDHLRGFQGAWDRSIKGLETLIRERDDHGLSFPIILKPTVNARNLELMPELVDWSGQYSKVHVYFQPIDHWTQETTEELWIGQNEMDSLRRIIDQLNEMKHAGKAIMNTESSMTLWPAHFLDQKAPPETLPCRVGLHNFFILANGNIEVCWKFPPIGNAKTQDVKEIWYGPRAQEVRKQTTRCKQLCLFTCLSHKTLRDKIKLALRLRGRQ